MLNLTHIGKLGIKHPTVTAAPVNIVLSYLWVAMDKDLDCAKYADPPRSG